MRTFVRLALTSHGHRVLEVETGREALQQAAAHTPDLILLDLGLPDMDGLEVTRQLREWSATPVIVISARGQERQKVEALDAGADDYITKPFGSAELMARIRVALRHAARTAQDPLSSVVTIGNLRIDLAKRQISVGRDRGPPHADRVQAARRADQARRYGADPQAAPRSGLGAGPRPSDAVPARLHGPAPPEARGEPGAPALPRDRAGRRVSARRARRLRLSATSTTCWNVGRLIQGIGATGNRLKPWWTIASYVSTVSPVFSVCTLTSVVPSHPSRAAHPPRSASA